MLFLLFCLVSCSEKPTDAPNGMKLVQIQDQFIYVDEAEVTNTEFKAFVDATNYVTTAEKDFKIPVEVNGQITDSLIQAGSLVFKPTEGPVSLNDFSQWWQWTTGASWKKPEGADSDIKERMLHPVVHVSFTDAQAYAKWAGKRIPNEKEWEIMAKGGKNHLYAWGHQSPEDSYDKANFWQGLFPYENKVADGYEGTAPVKSYEPNDFGLYDMSGNVWEWCIDANGRPIVKGGSFLCNDSYCSGYIISSRMPNDKESSLNHTGFRLVKNQD